MNQQIDVRALWVHHQERTRGWNQSQADAECDRLIDRVTEQLRTRPDLAAPLRASLRAADGDYRDFLAAVLVPDRRLAITDPEAFRAHPEVAFSATRMPIRLAAALVRVTIFPSSGGQLAKYTATWFGGRPLAEAGDEWPRSADGTPLAHVAQVHLGDDGYEQVPRSTELPRRGLLQVFHDLHTYGEPEDAGTQAWRVRWIDVKKPARLTRLKRPDDLDKAARIKAVPARVSPMATVPPFLDVDFRDLDEQERYVRVETWLEQYPYDRNAFMAPDLEGGESPWEQEDQSTPDPVSRLCGYGYNEFSADHQRILDARLPLDAGDEHVMLADINPAQFTDADWFHGQRHLQVWIRASDLAARHFDDCWCFIRTDG